MFNPNNRAGQWFQTHKRRVMNRGGSTAVAVGDVLALDMIGTAAETAAGEGVAGVTGLDVQDAIFHNVIEVAAANADGFIVVVSNLLSGAGAEDTEIEVTLCGQRVQCDLDGATAVVIGDRLIAVAAARHLVTNAQAATAHTVAYALEALASGTGTLDVVFFGGMPCNTIDDT